MHAQTNVLINNLFIIMLLNIYSDIHIFSKLKNYKKEKKSQFEGGKG